MEYVFLEPYKFEDKEYKSIELSVENIKGYDIAAVKRQWTAVGYQAPVPALDSEFCAMVAARVSKQPLEFFENLPSKDYIGLTLRVSNFLMA